MGGVRGQRGPPACCAGGSDPVGGGRDGARSPSSARGAVNATCPQTSKVKDFAPNQPGEVPQREGRGAALREVRRSGLHPRRGGPRSAELGGEPPRSRCPGRDPPLHRGRAPRGGIQEGPRMRSRPRTWPVRGGGGEHFGCPRKDMATVCCCLRALRGKKRASTAGGKSPVLSCSGLRSQSSRGRTSLAGGCPGQRGPRGVPCPGPCSTSVPQRHTGGAAGTETPRAASPQVGAMGTSHRDGLRHSRRHRSPLGNTDWLSFTSTTPDWLRPPQTPRVPPLQEAVGAPGPAC